MSSENYEYRIITLQEKNKEFYSSWIFKLTKRAELVMGKMAKDGWELTNTTHNIFGFPMVLTFRKPNASNNV